MFADFSERDRNDEDFFEEARQKLNNEPMVNFEERKNEISRSKNVFIGTVSGIALAAVVGWFVLSPRYAADGSADVPVIRRPQTAVKVQPVEPGGMEILNQDKSVYDIIEKKDTSAPVVENLLPPPEEPKLPVVAPAEETAVQVVDVTEQIKTSADETAAKAEAIIKVAEAPQPKAVQDVPEAEVQPLKEIVAAPMEEKAPQAVVPAAPSIAIPPKEAVKPEAVKVVVNVTEEAKTAAAGNWQIQLISSPNKAAMEKSWNDLSKKYRALQGLSHEVETADLGAKGTFYRLKAGAFAERGEADRICGEIKAQGGSCLVKKK